MAADDRTPTPDDESTDDESRDDEPTDDKPADDAPASDATSPEAKPRRSPRERLAERVPDSWHEPVTLKRWHVGAGFAAIATLLVLAIVTGALALTEPGSSGSADGGDAEAVSVSDQFQRGGEELGEAPTDQVWDEVRGSWATSFDGAQVREADGDLPSIAVVDLEDTDGVARIRTAVPSAGMGMVFRYRNPSNYMTITSAPDFGTWTVRRIANGQAADLGGVGIANTQGAVLIEVRMRGDSVDVYVDGEYRATFSDPVRPDATRAGLYAEVGSDAARWALFEAQNSAALTESPVVPSTTETTLSPPITSPG